MKLKFSYIYIHNFEFIKTAELMVYDIILSQQSTNAISSELSLLQAIPKQRHE